MIRRYRIGDPIPTEAVVQNVEEAAGSLPYWETRAEEKALRLCLPADARVYGLGGQVRGMNKRGWLYISDCTDEPHHTEDKHSLYAAHNFFLLLSETLRFGFFIDTPGRVIFDIGCTDPALFEIRFDDFDADLYLAEAEDAPAIVREFRRLIGKSYVPPAWAFGFIQSRWGYRNETDIREVADRFEEAGIPLDAVCLDIDYMDHFKDFTVDETAFPDFPAFVKEMRARGVRLVPIIDAGVKAEPGYDVYEEGLANHYFCEKEDGTPITAAVWPGRVHLPDFLKPEARAWFGGKYRFLVDQGIEGFWNDMNEPALFYTEEHLAEVFREVGEMQGREIGLSEFFRLQDLVGSLANAPEDYRKIFHTVGGRRVRHDKVHNLYGGNMTRAAAEALKEAYPEKQFLLFSRASAIGAHRHGGIWCGDNASWWSHLLLNIQQLPALNMAGFLLCGADIGGFGADVTEDLLLRWTAFGIFTPLMRNHSALGTRPQEYYRFPAKEAFRHLLELRYALIPFLQAAFEKAVREDALLFSPLEFFWPDDARAQDTEDELMLGDGILLAPVYRQNAAGRMVYLPEKMKLFRFRSPEDWDEEILSAGDHYIKARPEEVLLFLRRGHAFSLARPARHVEELNTDDLRPFCF